MAKINEEEVAATVAELPTVPPEGWIKYMRNKRMLNKDILIYSVAYIRNPLTGVREKMVKVVCTACGGTTHLDYVGGSEGCHCGGGSTYGFLDPSDGGEKRSGNTCICPCCGKGLEARHVGYVSNEYVIENETVISLCKVRGHVVVLSWLAEKVTDKGGQVTYCPRLYEGLLVIEGKLVRVKGYYRFMGGRVDFYKKWERMKAFSEEIPYVEKECILPFEDHIEYGTELENSALTEFLREARRVNVSKYIKLWKKFPCVEAVVKAGASNYVCEAIGNMDTCRGYYSSKSRMRLELIKEYFNVKEKKPHRILGVEKSEWQYVLCGERVVSLYKRYKERRGVKFTVGEIMLLRNIGWGLKNSFLIEGKHGYLPPVVRTLRYIERQVSGYGSLAKATMYEDFLEYQYKVYGRIEQEMSFPKNLIEAHDHLVLAYKEKEDRLVNDKIQKRLKEIGYLAFTDEKLGLFIKPCESHAEIIKEGKLLSHCVGGYADSHANGRTTILFIRHIAEPEVPYFTLEYRDGEVRQNRGKNNCERTEEVVAFEKEWLEYIKTKEKKHGNGRRKKSSVGA